MTTEVLDLSTMAFTPGPNLLSRRLGCAAAVRLDAHRCLVVGGLDGRSSVNSTEVLGITTMTFTAGPVMGSARYGGAAVPLDSTHILVVGGLDDNDEDLSTTEVRPRLTKLI